ncbi:MAG TPA: hypothetical protein VKT82_26925 [Ktedonobacterales bacterium]|nr:hypothetical protein [Ktedonobacterales bacterium]
MITRLPLLLLEIEPTGTSFSLSTIIITALLDFAGLAIAIWTVWSSIWLQRGGHLLHAFRFISLGSLALALSHLLDTILQMLNIDAATLIHQGAVLLAVLLFLPGLANLTDALPAFDPTKSEQLPRVKLWPLVTVLIIIISALSFIFYGLGLLAEVAAFFMLDGSLLILAALCLALVVRARLGGAIGHSLWLAVFGLILFSLAHPVQAWFYEQTDYAPDLLGIVHRLIVIPAFFLFAISITYAANALHQSVAA